MLLILNVCFLLFGASVLLWGAICVTGFFREDAADPGLHRQLAHPLVVAVLGLTVFGLAALFNCNGGRTRRRTALLGVVTTGFVMLAAFTGYLGPTRAEFPMPPHTHQRFIILHQAVLPTMSGVLLGLWCWSAARGPKPKA